MTDDFVQAVRTTLVAAREHAALLRDLTDSQHRRLCEELEARVVAVFQKAAVASEGFLQFHKKRDPNGLAMLYGLHVRRDAYTLACLFVRIDCFNVQTWWQLHEGGNLEHALGGWWNIPVLQIEDQEAFLRSKVLDLIRTLREAPSSYRSRF